MMLTDLEIAKGAKIQPIAEVASRIGIEEKYFEGYGKYKAKINLELLDTLAERPNGHLILVTAISPTPSGEGKTTTTVGLGDALNRIGKKTMICLREPSLGPVFGMKGGAAGGGMAQVIPMEDINLHFTGDFSAIERANNLLAALIDNHIHHGNELGFDIRRITWKRVMDMNDRALRHIIVSLGVSLGDVSNGYPRQDSFDIVVASEIMAIFCLATSLEDLKTRLANIMVGYTFDDKPIYARDLKAQGAMTILLRDALKPNLVQTLENNPALVHGGPFANIAHGCNSVIATKLGLKLADYVVTEAGFGADLGGEKFLDIKCRKAALKPSAAVIVATIRALKYHGVVKRKNLTQENTAALERGVVNLERHIRNLQSHYGVPCVVAINQFDTDSPAEIALLQSKSSQWEIPVVNATHWSQGGAGAEALARALVETVEQKSGEFRLLYPDEMPIWEKMRTIATKIYGAADISADKPVLDQIKFFQENGFGHFPVCVAKTQYSFSTNPKLLGAPEGHTIHVREVRLSAGAEFIVMICGDIMTMPGLPRVPAAVEMDIDALGNISGLS